MHTRPASLYTKFMNYPLKKESFVNMENGIDRSILEDKFTSYKSSDTWKDLHCTNVKNVGPFLVITDCRTPDGTSEYAASDPSKHKIFVKLGRRRLNNLADYIRLVQLGVIRQKDHNSLFRFIERQRRKVQEKSGTSEKVTAFNHNMEVGVLHFKFRCESDYKCRAP